MPQPDLSIIVCIDPRACLIQESHGRNGANLYQDLRESIRQAGLEERARVTPCRCILGCTYGPRVDVARRWSGEKSLYGTIDGEVNISIRGRVRILELPEDLSQLINDNLPD